MIFKYSIVKSVGCLKKSSVCFIIQVLSYFKKGKGLIFYKNFLDKKIINIIKFILFYLNINFSLYNFYLSIKPFNFKKIDNCLELCLFFSIFFSFFKLCISKNIVILGNVDFKNGKILKINNMNYKIKAMKNEKLLIISNENKIYFNKNLKISILKFNYLYEVYFFFKRCLAQRKSSAITKRSSRVQFSQHLENKNVF